MEIDSERDMEICHFVFLYFRFVNHLYCLRRTVEKLKRNFWEYVIPSVYRKSTCFEDDNCSERSFDFKTVQKCWGPCSQVTGTNRVFMWDV